uniref:Uncharacterized protein n=1 Tax=Anopheles atroparvus TaxID=41427 RepID=A0A182JLK3_ANOAO
MDFDHDRVIEPPDGDERDGAGVAVVAQSGKKYLPFRGRKRFAVRMLSVPMSITFAAVINLVSGDFLTCRSTFCCLSTFARQSAPDRPSRKPTVRRVVIVVVDRSDPSDDRIITDCRSIDLYGDYTVLENRFSGSRLRGSCAVRPLMSFQQQHQQQQQQRTEHHPAAEKGSEPSGALHSDKNLNGKNLFYVGDAARQRRIPRDSAQIPCGLCLGNRGYAWSGWGPVRQTLICPGSQSGRALEVACSGGEGSMK